MDGGMTVDHACKQMRLDITRVIRILWDERMTEFSKEIETILDKIVRQVDTSRQYHEQEELSSLKGHCMSVIHQNNKLAVIYYGKVDWRE